MPYALATTVIVFLLLVLAALNTLVPMIVQVILQVAP